MSVVESAIQIKPTGIIIIAVSNGRGSPKTEQRLDLHVYSGDHCQIKSQDRFEIFGPSFVYGLAG